MSGDLPKCSFKVTGSPAGVEVPAVTIKPGSVAKNRPEKRHLIWFSSQQKVLINGRAETPFPSAGAGAPVQAWFLQTRVFACL